MTSISDLIVMFIMQIFIVAFIEESVFRGIMLRMLVAKGAFLLSGFLVYCLASHMHYNY